VFRHALPCVSMFCLRGKTESKRLVIIGPDSSLGSSSVVYLKFQGVPCQPLPASLKLVLHVRREVAVVSAGGSLVSSDLVASAVLLGSSEASEMESSLKTTFVADGSKKASPESSVRRSRVSLNKLSTKSKSGTDVLLLL
jgi:hypothetical protein